MMTKQTTIDIVIRVKEKFKYWDSDDALKYTSMLFPFSPADQKIRDALKALSCKKDKDERYRKGQSALESKGDFRDVFREMEFMFERSDSRYRKRDPETERDSFRETLMMMMSAMMNQKGTVTVSLDVNAFTETVYKECEMCPIRDVCKEAFPICTEYVATALDRIDITESSDE